MVPNPEEVTDEMLAADSPFMQARMAWAERQEKLAVTDDSRQLDLTDMPKFGGRWKRSLGESIEAMTPGLAVLLLTFAASVMVTLMRFLTYDPR
jgi:hypothetical protein